MLVYLSTGKRPNNSSKVSMSIDTRSLGKGIFIMKISEGGRELFMQKQVVMAPTM
jgi:hypothetical protein